MTTHTRTHTKVTFANPNLRCVSCNAKAEGFHDQEKCGCNSGSNLVPCGHMADTVNTDPTWTP